MKVLLIVQQNQLRGAEIFASQLGNQLLKNHDVIMVSLFKGNAVLPFDGEVIALDRPLAWRLFDLKGYKKLAKIIRERDIEVVQANAGDTLKFAVFSKILFRWQSPIVYRNASKIGYWINSRLKLIFNRFLLQHVDRIVSVSEVCRTDFIETFPNQRNKVSMIEIGVDLQEVRSAPHDMHSIFNAGPVLVHVGALELEKNHKGLMRIFKKVKARLPAVQLVLVGSGSLQADLKNYAEDLGISESVYFIGRRNDVLEIVKASQAFLLTSEVEGLPAVVLESMYCGTPVVAYNVGGVGEVVQADTGWLIDKNDEVNFANATIEALTESQKVASRVNKAYQRIINYFNNSLIAARFEAVYFEINKRR
jgi:glycosyltransferase involved in cell wall biosynthesis